MSATMLTFRSQMPVSAEDAFAWHARDGAFERLSPPWANVKVVEARGGIAPGDSKTLRIGAGPLGVRWTLKHESMSQGQGFVDEQQEGPFESWRHVHKFIPESKSSSILEDQLTFQLPVGQLGQLFGGKFVNKQLDELFRFRHDQTRHDLRCFAGAGTNIPKRVAITGASGLVGRHLKHFLQAGGVEVFSLVRGKATAEDQISWDPTQWTIDSARLEGMDAVIHLAGTSIADGRWTPERKRSILQSRLDGTSLLSTTLAKLENPPRVLVSASAVGYYGDAGTTTLDESSPKGEGFLADVCDSWEKATIPARHAGIRVITPRFGIVLSGAGGMLPLVSRPVRMGAGGPLGSGKQEMSWIALDDLLGILLEAVVNEDLAGPLNAVAPEPTSNGAFTKTLAHVLRRPSFFKVPAPVLRLVAGQLADELLLVSQAAVPTKLQDVGFKFTFPTLESALRHELGRYGGKGGVDDVESASIGPASEGASA
ncbi:MAG: TIGR01777 family oxidoreductase [Thermomicrobiales bacterium]